MTAAHCICCYHDNAGFCQNPETHHCLPNDMNKPSNHQKIPANQIVGEYPPRTGISHFPFNRINIVVGLKNIDAFDLWRKDDHIFQADDAYVINAEEENGKLYLRANDRYDIGIVRARLFPEEYSKLKLEPLSLPSQYDNKQVSRLYKYNDYDIEISRRIVLSFLLIAGLTLKTLTRLKISNSKRQLGERSMNRDGKMVSFQAAV